MEEILKEITATQTYDLHQVIPTCPKKEDILFHDHLKAEQYWTKPYNLTDSQFLRLSYAEQEDIVERENERCKNGVWFYNFGEPTYLTGDNYNFLTYYKMEGHIVPDFMKFQTATFYFYLYAELERSVYGTLELKPRREGCTHRKLSIALNRAIMNESFFVGIQSKGGKDAKEANFDNVVKAYMKLPCWRKPKSRLDNPSRELAFEQPPKRSSTKVKTLQEIEYEDYYLNSKIDWRATSTDAYDGDKLHIYICDEFWKWVTANAAKALKTHKKCLVDGEDIKGIMYVLSTVGIDQEEEKITEEAFNTGKEIWNGSSPLERNALGETETGLLRMFISTFDSKRGHSRISDVDLLDKYGNVNSAEARKIWNIKYDSCKTNEDRTTLIRQEPPNLQQAIASFSRSGSTFDNERLGRRLLYLENFVPTDERPVKYWVGNFAWKNNERFTEVVRIEKENGKWRLPYLPMVAGQDKLNRIKKLSNDAFAPFADTQFVLGVDPFNYKNTVSGQGSKGAGHMKLKHNFANPDFSNKYCGHYRERPASPDLFFEDMLMFAWYYGAKINAERSGSDIFNWFKRNGVYGFLMFRPEITKNSAFTKGDKEKGTTATVDNIELGCNLTDNYFALPDEETNDNVIDNLDYFWDEITLRQLMEFEPAKRERLDAAMALFMTEIGCQSVKKIFSNTIKVGNERNPIDFLFPIYKDNKVITHRQFEERGERKVDENGVRIRR